MAQQLQVIEHGEQRVLTTAQLAEAFGTDVKVISNNFNRNKSRYEEGKHHVALRGQALREFKSIHQNDEQFKQAPIVYLWTEKGAWMHAKSLNTDKAWEAYEMLVDDYYRIKAQVSAPQFRLPQTYKEALLDLVAKIEENERLETQLAIAAPKVDMFDKFLDTDGTYSIDDVAKMLRCPHPTRKNAIVGEKMLFQFLRDNKILRINNRPMQTFIDRKLFSVRTTVAKITRRDGSGTYDKENVQPRAYPEGIEFIRRKLVEAGWYGTGAIEVTVRTTA